MDIHKLQIQVQTKVEKLIQNYPNLSLKKTFELFECEPVYVVLKNNVETKYSFKYSLLQDLFFQTNMSLYETEKEFISIAKNIFDELTTE